MQRNAKNAWLIRISVAVLVCAMVVLGMTPYWIVLPVSFAVVVTALLAIEAYDYQAKRRDRQREMRRMLYLHLYGHRSPYRIR
ncbi:hypothetical protein L0Y59_03480 [Candidatus Uhrbacteria bacterium]|nr:hypothetical protein [Candidatus Uhrbacteria bacterium]